jgi:sugar/nucleoside kinase (ribokinase family)
MATSAALAIAALEGNVQIVSTIGNDARGVRYLSEVASRSVNVSAVTRVDGAQTAVCPRATDSTPIANNSSACRR